MTPIEYIYYMLYRLHRRQGTARQKRLCGRTISVGNLSLGGTGKTPLVINISKESIRRGFSTCILTRGYKSKTDESMIVSRGEGPLVSWQECGDEAYLMASRIRGAWVVKDSNRYRGGLIAGEKDVYILDDGFQHWRLYRDIDIVVIDTSRPSYNDRLLPLGRLREPFEEIKRADLIVLNRAENRMPHLEDMIRRYNKDAPIFYSEIEPVSLADIRGKQEDISVLKGKRVVIFSGIGNPKQFRDSFYLLNANVVETVEFRDHFVYDEKDIEKITGIAFKKKADMIITTEKDIIKLHDYIGWFNDIPLFAMRIKLEIREKKFYDILFQGIKSNKIKKE